MAVNNTFQPNALANTSGRGTITGQEMVVEFLSANPTNTSGVPRIWFNTTDFKLYTYDGTTQRSSAAQA
ncbi:hypothetical protein LOZ80_38075 [Paenibacillus sp. HWE-109]|uniref:hypothetical protein n=1 Tax=Paenibacillus sp. HWE-109 TaxID=1306526 RepID=UPI001EDDB7D5|nr:hypothetical protein [Paenibacillus sp. HWE-109]UKS27201.1 hypothetical protein LOZ80_38075 [Paenibacillus sp. HWE-109]